MWLKQNVSPHENHVNRPAAHHQITRVSIDENTWAKKIPASIYGRQAFIWKYGIKDEERMKTSLTEEKWKQFEQPLSDPFKDGSSKLNNHSAMAVGKFILALSV